MARSHRPEIHNIAPYYDDFSEDKNFARVLFRPGVAVQARELTQAQTILQNQLERFGDHIFENGSVVSGAAINEQLTRFMRLKDDGATVGFTDAVLSGLAGQRVENDFAGRAGVATSAIITHAIAGSTLTKDTTPVIFFDYQSGGLFTNDEVITITGGGLNDGLTFQIDQDRQGSGAGTTAIGLGADALLVNVGQGVYFADGNFIQSSSSNVFVPLIDSLTGGYRDFDKPSNSLGFNINREYVSSDQDETLRDPSYGFNNYNAPGADRYKLSLSPKQIEFDGISGSASGLTFNTEDYFEVARVINGETSKSSVYSNYADLEDSLARRTFDESGHYTVRPFALSFGTNENVFGSIDTTKFGAIIGPGKAYIRGYEFETITPSYLSLVKARTLGTLRNLTTPASPENMVQIDLSLDHHLGSGDINNLDAHAVMENLLVGLFQADDPSAAQPNFTLIGTAFLRTVQASFETPDDLIASAGLSNVKMFRIDPTSSSGTRFNFNSDTDLIRTFDDSDFAEISGGTNNPNNTCMFRTKKTTAGLLIFTGNDGRGAGDANQVFPLLTADQAQARVQTLSSDPNAPFNTVAQSTTGLSTRTAHSVFLRVRFQEGSVTSDPVAVPDDSCSFIPPQANAYTLFLPRNDNAGNAASGVAAFGGNRYIKPSEYVVTVNQSTGSLTININSTAAGVRVQGGDNLDREVYGIINATVFRDSIPNDYTHNIRTLSLNSTVMSNFDQRTIVGTTQATTLLNPETLYNDLFGRDQYSAKNNGTNAMDVSNRGARPNQPVFELDHAHVYDIIEITDINGDVVTDRFELLDGQKPDAFYHSSVRLISGKTIPRVTNSDFALGSISYRYFSHAGLDKPITVDSYPSTLSVEQIPRFTDPESGIEFSLANAVDFRPVEKPTADRRNEGSTHGFDNVGNLPGSRFDVVGNYPRYDASVYLPRVDSIALSPDKTFKLLSGVPSINPVAPDVTDELMELYQVDIPAYTDNASDVRARYVDNQRFTMSDIGVIDNTVEDDERFNYISELENEAISRVGAEPGSGVPERSAIFVDECIGHNNSDVLNRDHNVSIDVESREIRPSFIAEALGLTQSSLNSGVTLSPDGIYTLDYANSDIVLSRKANASEKGNPDAVIDYLGTVKLNPQSDYWFDTTTAPVVVVNTVGENNAFESAASAFKAGRFLGWGSRWNEWNAFWYGNKKKSDTVSADPEDYRNRQYRGSIRSGFVKRIFSNRITRSVGNKVVDLSVVPFMRAVTLNCTVEGMIPGSTAYAFMDNVSVGAVAGYEVGSTGSFTTSIALQKGRYQAGAKRIQFLDDSLGRYSASNSIAEDTFYAQGILDQEETDVNSVSVRPPIKTRFSVRQSNLFDVNDDGNVTEPNQGLLPLAQTFTVDKGQYPLGVFLTGVKLFVKTAPFNADTPVFVDLRPCDPKNGNAPSINTVHRFSQVSKSVTDSNLTVNDNPDDASGTSFNFSSPVYLPPGRHALTVRCNDADFALHSGLIGQTMIDKFGNPTDDTVSQVPYANGLYLPTNNGAREPYTDRVLMFDLIRADFIGAEQSLSAREVNFVTETDENIDGMNLTRFAANNQIVPSGNDISISSVLRYNDFDTSSTVDVTVPVNSDVVLDEKGIVGGASNPGKIFARLSADEQKRVSPILDAERLALLRVEMQSNNSPSVGAPTEELNSSGESSTIISKYIGKKVVLDRPARDFRAYVQADIPQGARIHVFVKAQGPDTIEDFDDLPYIQLFPDGVKDDVAPLPGGSVGDVVDFRNPNIGAENGIDIKFTPAALTEANVDDEGALASPSDGNLITTLMPNGGEFVAYQVKIVIYAPADGSGNSNHSNNGLGPVIRRLRCAAIDTPRSVVAPPPPNEQEGMVRAINTAKAWGVVEVDASDNVNIKRAFNVDSVTRESTGVFRVELLPNILFARDTDGNGQDAGDELNMVVVFEPADVGGHQGGLRAGNFSGVARTGRTVLTRLTVVEKTIENGRPSFTMLCSRLRMTEYDNNDDGNGRNRVQYDNLDPLAADASGGDDGVGENNGSKGSLCFVVFGSNDSTGDIPGEGITKIP